MRPRAGLEGKRVAAPADQRPRSPPRCWDISADLVVEVLRGSVSDGIAAPVAAEVRGVRVTHRWPGAPWNVPRASRSRFGHEYEDL